MSDAYLWIIPAKEEEKGSFSDTTSEVLYQNVSKEEAEERKEGAAQADVGIVSTGGSPSNFPEDQRFNLTVRELDSVGSDYPAKHTCKPS